MIQKTNKIAAGPCIGTIQSNQGEGWNIKSIITGKDMTINFEPNPDLTSIWF